MPPERLCLLSGFPTAFVFSGHPTAYVILPASDERTNAISGLPPLFAAFVSPAVILPLMSSAVILPLSAAFVSPAVTLPLIGALSHKVFSGHPTAYRSVVTKRIQRSSYRLSQRVHEISIFSVAILAPKFFFLPHRRCCCHVVRMCWRSRGDHGPDGPVGLRL